MSNCHHRTYARQGSQIWFSKIYCEKSLKRRILSKDTFPTKFSLRCCVVSKCFHPPTDTCTHSRGSCLPWQESINRDEEPQYEGPQSIYRLYEAVCVLPKKSSCTMQRQMLLAAFAWRAPYFCNPLMCARTWLRNSSFQLSLLLLYSLQQTSVLFPAELLLSFPLPLTRDFTQCSPTL